MRLKKLILKNIRSYKEQEIDFPEGSLLLSGDVGSGKTTILMAIEYALFGLQPGQKGSALLRNDSNLGEVSLKLEVGGKEVTIERKIRRGTKGVTNDYASITLNDKKVESSITEVKTKVLNLLGYPPEFIKKNNILYRYTVYTPQEQMKQIILEDPETRLNVLRHVFGIDKYKRIRENLSILLARMKEDSRYLQFEIQTLDKEKEALESLKKEALSLMFRAEEKAKELSSLKQDRKDLESQAQEMEGKYHEKNLLEAEIEKTKIMIGSKREAIIAQAKEIKDLSENIGGSQGAYREEDLASVLNELSSAKSNLEALNSKYISVASKINSLEELKKENLDKKNRVFSMTICPTCLQDVPGAHKHNIMNAAENKLVEVNASLVSLQEEKLSIKSFIEKSKEDIHQLEDRKSNLLILKSKMDLLEGAVKRRDELNRTKEALEKDIILLSSHLDTLKEALLKFSTFDLQIKAKREELRRAFQEEKGAEISLAELKKESELTEKEISRYEASIKSKESSKERLAKILELIDWLSHYFLELIDFTERNVLIRLRKEFSNLFANWFAILAGDTFSVQLDENFTPLIMQGEVEMEYSFLSGGERTAVALAYRLALNQTINSLLSTIKTKDLIILDEPTEGFSEAQVDKIRDILNELNVAQLIIVSHEQKVESFVENVLRLKKDSDISTLTTTANGGFGYHKT